MTAVYAVLNGVLVDTSTGTPAVPAPPFRRAVRTLAPCPCQPRKHEPWKGWPRDDEHGRGPRAEAWDILAAATLRGTYPERIAARDYLEKGPTS